MNLQKKKRKEKSKKKKEEGKQEGTTNLNSVTINLSDKHLYEISYKDYEFFNKKH